MQGIIKDISYAKEVVFCARTGKIFLTGHYNQLKEFIKNGGKFKYITSENFNVSDDDSEFQINQKYAKEMMKNLKKLAPDKVECFNLNNPVNNTYLYIKMNNDEKINVKFNFQTKMKNRHPMFWIHIKNPYFGIFYDELMGLIQMAEIIDL